MSDTGVITFVGKIPGGNLDDTYAYVSIKEGIDGKMLVTPAQDESGENIIMLYYIKSKIWNNLKTKNKMKKLLLIGLVALGVTACKKEYHYYGPQEAGRRQYFY